MKVLAALHYGQIRSEPSLARPLILDSDPCPVCGGRPRRGGGPACPNCHGWLKACVLVAPARTVILPETVDVPRAAELARNGSWPNGRGGWLHETASCVAAVYFWWDLQAYWRAKLQIPAPSRH